MFNLIAPKYDLMNSLITFGLDQPWRRRCLNSVRVGPGDRLLDVACGTGDLATLALRKGAEVVGVDYADKMLAMARARTRRVGTIRFVQGDAGRLPVKDASVNAVTCGFALRNFVDLEGVIHEMGRVLAPTGRVAILEVGDLPNPFIRACHSFYFEKVVPLLGALLADGPAYRYLPASVQYLPEKNDLLEMFRQAGFRAVRHQKLMFGTAQIITGIKSD
jgi:demethylmenaquinone methyltransferase/2-methoxy-6-polyprenyl-1,4-benzoquinol methylase